MWLPLLGFVLSVVLLVLLKIRQLTRYWEKRGIPHESYWSSLYTNFVRFRHEDIYKVMVDYSAHYGPVYGTYQGLRPVLRVTSIEGVKDLFIRNFSSAYNRSIVGETGTPIWDQNILVLDYALWKAVRHPSSASFSANKLKLMLPKLETIARRQAGKFEKLAVVKHGSICPYDYIYGAAIDRIALIAYGIELDAVESPDHPFVKNTRGVFSPSLGLTMVTIMPWILKYLPIHFPPKHIANFFTQFTATLIKERRQRGPRENDVDVLDCWLAEQKNNPEITDEIIAAQAFVFFVAGFDTSANTLYYTMYLLAMHPHVQEMAYREIQDIAPDPDNITYEQYTRMKMVEACALETLRLYPSDYVVDRTIAKPCTIAGVPMEPGTVVQVPIPAIQRDPSIFPDPDEFFPQRFLPDVTPDAAKQLEGFLAFGTGPRNCLGKRLALLTVTMELAAILRRVKLTPAVKRAKPADIELGPGQHFLAMPKDQLLIQVEPRV